MTDGSDSDAIRKGGKTQKKGGWSLRRNQKPKERRTVWVNVEGVKTDPRGYERNKVRTSKYTLLSFVPKVCFADFSRICGTLLTGSPASRT